MNITSHINDLLYRYECVIVPNFGGFVTNVISSKINRFTHTFEPPMKQITFNSNLKNNDGLLANYIAATENVSYDKACEIISNCVSNWKNQLTNESLLIANIGVIKLNKEGQYIFEPEKTTNYLTSSFGLFTITSPLIKRSLATEETIPVVLTTDKNRSSSLLKYAATAAVFLTLGSFGWKSYNQQQLEKTAINKQQQIEKKIQSATFIIDTPLPTIELNLLKKNTKKFHVIAGAFQSEVNAQKKLEELIKKGFDAAIVGKNKWGLTQVSYASSFTKQEANKDLSYIKMHYATDAWILIQD